MSVSFGDDKPAKVFFLRFLLRQNIELQMAKAKDGSSVMGPAKHAADVVTDGILFLLCRHLHPKVLFSTEDEFMNEP